MGESSRPKATTVRDIAKALKISIGTVDRALHNRPEVSAITRDKVLHAASKLGYRANQAARYLSTGGQKRIAICLPKQIEMFFYPLSEGMRTEGESWALAGVSLEFHYYPRMGVGEERAFHAALERKPDGMILCPGGVKELKPLIQKAARHNIPVMCVASDAPGTARVSVVSIDPGASGSMVAELMGRFLAANGIVALVTGDLRITDHRQKLDAYCKVSRDLFPKLLLLPPIQAHDDHAQAHKLFRQQLTRHPDISGVYVSTVNALPILRALKDAERIGKVVVIVTDLYPELIPYMERSHIVATVYQRPETQGQIAVRAMCRLLLEGTKPPPQIRLAPHLVMKGNLPYFLGQSRFEDFVGSPLTFASALS